jgi:hypothetical protein
MRDFARKLLPATHFEVTAVMPVVRDLMKDPIKNVGDEDTYFLPSDTFWFEYVENQARFGYLVTDFKWPKLNMQAVSPGSRDIKNITIWSNIRFDIDDEISSHAKPVVLLRNLLKLINHPRVINQQTFNPHAGLQKKLIAAKAMTGKFPLKAWTNLTLKCGEPPEDKSGVAPKKTILSGARCQHWVISHRRVIGGVERIVKGHWRGDPSLGIKRSRYILE